MQLDYSTEGDALVPELLISSHIGHRYLYHMYLRFVWLLNQKDIVSRVNLLVVCNSIIGEFC